MMHADGLVHVDMVVVTKARRKAQNNVDSYRLTPNRVKAGAKVRVTGGSMRVGSVGHIVGPEGSAGKVTVDFGVDQGTCKLDVARLQLLELSPDDRDGLTMMAAQRMAALKKRIAQNKQPFFGRKNAEWDF